MILQSSPFLSEAFREGFRSGFSTMNVIGGLLVLVAVLALITAIFIIYQHYTREQESEDKLGQRTLSDLTNHRALDEQGERYLRALLETFKAQYTHDQEVGITYLHRLLEFALPRLSQSRSIRRKTNVTPPPLEQRTVMIITEYQNHFSVLRAEGLKHNPDEGKLVLKKPSDYGKTIFEGAQVEIVVNHQQFSYYSAGQITVVGDDKIHLERTRPFHHIERRRDDRQSVQISARFHGDDQAWEATVVDLSLHGARLMLEHEADLEPTSTGTLTLRSSPQLQLDCQVRHIANLDSGGTTIGVEFTYLSDQEQKVLRDILS